MTGRENRSPGRRPSRCRTRPGSGRPWDTQELRDPDDLSEVEDLDAAPFSRRRFPGLAQPEDHQLDAGQFERVLGGLGPACIGLVPAGRPADALPALGWNQAFASAVPYAAALRSWEDRFGAQILPLAGYFSTVIMRSTPADPPQVVRLRRDGEPAAWTTLNAGLAKSRRLRVRELRWAGSDGTQIEGLLAEPDDGAGPRPLVVDIHGGPSLAFHHSWDMAWAELLTAAGYAVLMPNPRGGAGRGQAFGRANLGDPAGSEFADIQAGLAHCADVGLADPGRVAAIGASYGGYLTAWAIALGGQFRCGVVIAGISDLVSVRGTANNSPFYDYLLQGRPADQPARYLDRSPVTWLSAASSPALILHGRDDRCVPVSQAEELYAGLREFGVPAEFVCYPREGHQATEPEHVADQRERILRWLATHLGAAS